MSADAPVDLLYLARDRLEFTRETFATLLRTTDWSRVGRLSVYDDGSRDGTDRWLAAAVRQAPVAARFVRTRFASPVAAMRHWIETSTAPLLAKVDNDAMLPPGWLAASLAVLEQHPELHLLGIEAMYPHADAPATPRAYAPADFISGLGLYRRSAFARSRPLPLRRWFGLEEWQVAQGAGLVRGWITPALPVFLLDRVPHDPWRGWSDEYIRRGVQRPWPKYAADCPLWRWRWPADGPFAPCDLPVDQPVAGAPALHSPAPSAPAARPAPRFVGALRVKNESPHINEVLQRILPLCERVLVFDDHSTDDTVARCQALGERVSVIRSPFEGLDEVRDKNELLRHLLALDPEWVLWIDGDEFLERQGPRLLRRAADGGPAVGVYALRVAYVWDDPAQVRVDGVYGHFARPSFFRLRDQPRAGLRFAPSGAGGNLHCGNIPRGLVGATATLPVRLKHLGYLTREQRLAKYAWYNAVDPDNDTEDRYRHLAEIPGARWAPGPPRFERWTE